MSKQTTNEEMFRYLLGDLTVEEQDRLEELYFEDDKALDRLLLAESELIEGYVSGQMTGAERERFRTNYLNTPERLRRVELVEQLRLRANEEAEETAPAKELGRARAPLSWWRKLLGALYPQTQSGRAAFAFGAVAVVFASALLFNQTRELRTRLRMSEQERAALENRVRDAEQRDAERQARETELAQKLGIEQETVKELSVVNQQDAQAPAAPQEKPPVVPSLELDFVSEVQTTFSRTPNVKSAAPRTERLTVPKESRLVRLSVSVAGGAYQSYTLTVRRADGSEVVTRTGLSPRFAGRGQVITTHIHASLLKSGDYEVVLSGRREDGTVEVIKEYPVTVEVK